MQKAIGIYGVDGCMISKEEAESLHDVLDALFDDDGEKRVVCIREKATGKAVPILTAVIPGKGDFAIGRLMVPMNRDAEILFENPGCDGRKAQNKLCAISDCQQCMEDFPKEET